MSRTGWALAPLPVFIILFVLLALPATRHAGSNVMVRFATAVRLVQAHTLELGSFADQTHDVAIIDGRAFLDKAPGVSFAIVPAFALINLFTDDLNLARHLTRLLSLLPLALLACFILWRRLPDWGVDEDLRLVAIATLAVGTIGWPYFVMIFGHGYVAALVLIGVLLLMQYRCDSTKIYSLYLSGLSFGLAISCEYPAAVLGATAGIYLLSFERRIGRVAVFAALGMLVPAAIIGFFNNAAFGGPLHFGYEFEKVGRFQEEMSKGLMGIGIPSSDTLQHLLLSPAKGLFFWNPVLHVGLIGMLLMVRHQRREGLWLLGMFVAYVLLFSGYYEAGGAASLGPRHLVPLIGPLVIAAVWLAAKTGKGGAGIFAALAIVTSLLMAVGVFAEPQIPERVANPLWEFALPMLMNGIGTGNLLGLPDGIAFIIALVLLLVLWVFVLWPRSNHSLWQSKLFRRSFLITLLAALSFYLLFTPYISHTEPGLLHQVKGNHFMIRGDYPTAAAEYEAAYMTRKDPWILYYQAQAYYRADMKEQGDLALQKLMEIDPSLLSSATAQNEETVPQ